MDHSTASTAEDIEFEGENIAFDPTLEDTSYEKELKSCASTHDANPVDLEWRDLTISVPVKKSRNDKSKEPAGRKTILFPQSGYVRAGQMLAVMGASGSGKTTLLNLLAGRITTTKGAQASGTVHVNGEPRDYSKFKQIAAYVLQDDDMFSELTVQEQISYAATLRLPRDMTPESKNARVKRVIDELGLAKVRDTRIGGALARGVSGGERKRVSIGTELVTSPSLLFLDEPTTGLDSFNALNVMQSLRHLATSGRTVVCTIHQPRSSIGQLFDQLLLLSESRVMYFGPAKDAVAYFSSLSFQSPPHFNPSDFFLDLLSVDPRSPEKEATTRKRIKYIGDKYAAQENLPALNSKHDDPERQKDELVADAPESKPRQYQSSWWKEFAVLTGRSFRLASRERVSNGIRLFQVIFFSIILGLIWLRNGQKEGLQAKRSLSGVLFFILINQSFGGVFSVIFQFPSERSIITRERASNMYRTSSYFVSKTMTDMPKTLVFNTIFSLIVYWMVGLRADAGAFFKYLLALFLVSTFSESLALAVSIMAGDAQASASLIPVFVILCILFGGFFIEADQLPDWLKWFKFVSFIFYGFGALTINQFPSDSTDPVVAQVRQLAGFSPIPYWVNIAALAGLTLFVKCIGFLFLRYLRGPRFLKF